MQIGSVHNGVLIGEDGYLFLVGGGHRIAEFASGKEQVTADSLENFRTNLMRRQRFCQKRGIRFRHIIVPDKHNVMRKRYPLETKQRTSAKYIRLSVRDFDDVLSYPLQMLCSVGQDVYQKTDSHLSDEGCISLVSHEMEQVLEELRSVRTTILANVSRRELSITGDLGSKLDPAVSSNETFYKPLWDPAIFTNNVKGNNGIIDLYFTSRSLTKLQLVIFGNSFFRQCAPFFSLIFKEVVFFRTPYFHAELVSQISPDVVLTENCERYLSNVNSDRNRPSIFMYPFLGNKTNSLDLTPDFARAMSAQLSFGRPPYFDFIENL